MHIFAQLTKIGRHKNFANEKVNFTTILVLLRRKARKKLFPKSLPTFLPTTFFDILALLTWTLRARTFVLLKLRRNMHIALLEGVRPLIKMCVKRGLKKSRNKDYFFTRKVLNKTSSKFLGMLSCSSFLCIKNFKTQKCITDLKKKCFIFGSRDLSENATVLTKWNFVFTVLAKLLKGFAWNFQHIFLDEECIVERPLLEFR